MRRVLISLFVLYLLTTCDAGAGGVPQATLNLDGGDSAQCHTKTTNWDLHKQVDSQPPVDGTTVTFDIDVTETSDAADIAASDTITANGWLKITNGGGADAPIGSIVANLQVLGGSSKLTRCTNIANAACGHDGTRATVVKGVSQSDNVDTVCAAVAGNANVCQFTETASCSGDFVFTTVTGDDLFSLVPDPVLKAGQSWVLYYSASFINTGPSGLNIAIGASIRMEILVTFGNAGGRGGSGASVPGPADLDGSGAIGDKGTLANGICSEHTGSVTGNSIDPTSSSSIRTVAFRKTFTLAPVENCYSTVKVTDPISANVLDGVSATADAQNPEDPAITIDQTTGTSVSSTTRYTLTYTGVAVTNDVSCVGSITDTATLTGARSSPGINITAPSGSYQTVYCCPGFTYTSTAKAIFQKSSCQTTGCTGPCCAPGSCGTPGGADATICSFTQGKMANKNSAAAFQNAVVWNAIASNDNDGNDNVFTLGSYPSHYYIQITTGPSLTTFFGGKGGTPGTLDGIYTNPTTTSAKNFATQVGTLAVEVALGKTVIVGGVSQEAVQVAYPAESGSASGSAPLTPIGTVIYCPQTPNALSGLTIQQISTFAQGVLGRGVTFPVNGFPDVTTLLGLVDSINNGFDDCRSIHNMPDFQLTACNNFLPGQSNPIAPVALGAGLGGLFLLGGVGGAVYCRRRRRSVAQAPKPEASISEATEVVVIHSPAPAASV